MEIKYLGDKFAWKDIVKDITRTVIVMWYVVVSFCTAVENGWLPADMVGMPCNVSCELFYALYVSCLVGGITIVIMKAMFGKYKIGVYKTSVLNKSEQTVKLNNEEE